MRYPGHAALMQTFRDTGFFSKNEVDVNGVRIRPLDLTAALMFPQWKLPEGEQDVSVMKVIITGTRNGRQMTITHDMLDRYDPLTSTTSMARTTGYTCAVTARQLVNGSIQRKGIIPPEFLGMDDVVFEQIMQGLDERDVRFHTKQLTIDN
jgi:saccharopine dehydrogenase-like NADP-dependent oxidoreductase